MSLLTWLLGRRIPQFVTQILVSFEEQFIRNRHLTKPISSVVTTGCKNSAICSPWFGTTVLLIYVAIVTVLLWCTRLWRVSKPKLTNHSASCMTTHHLRCINNEEFTAVFWFHQNTDANAEIHNLLILRYAPAALTSTWWIISCGIAVCITNNMLEKFEFREVG